MLPVEHILPDALDAGPNLPPIGYGELQRRDLHSSGEIYVTWYDAYNSTAGGGSLGNPGPSWLQLAQGISTATAIPISCGRTAAARSISGN